MSSRKSKRNKNNNSKNNNDKNNSNENDSNSNSNTDHRSTITFKFPGRWATLSCLVPFKDDLTITELLRKIRLSTSNQPPDAQKLFELYFMDEIYPFISKHAQDTVNTKKDIGKVWNLQTNDFQDMYNKRAEVLVLKWREMRGQTDGFIHGGGAGNRGGSNSNNIAIPLDDNSQTVIFKYYSIHSSAKTNRHIIIRQPSKEELLSKIKLNKSTNPPTAKQLFEIYYYDEILPFLKKSGQQSIRGKKDLSKVWQIQAKTFKNLYEDRSRILTQEWHKLISSGSCSSSSKGDRRNRTPRTPKTPRTSTSTSINHHLNNNNIDVGQLCYKKIDCRLIRTLLNFVLFLECSTKKNCFMLLVNNLNERYLEYEKLKQFVKGHKDVIKDELCFIHIRVFIGNFESDSLRLHTSNNMIKLCFINPLINDKEKELCTFELRFNKLFAAAQPPFDNKKIDDKNIEASIDEETKILSVDIPIL